MPSAPTRISTDDIRAKAEQIREQADSSVSSAAPKGLAVIGVAAIVALLLAYLLGRRKGRDSRTVVEVRRL
jgi:ElaB/YqjD/DUF883 family membrane-anchored ribosome-binding protein